MRKDGFKMAEEFSDFLNSALGFNKQQFADSVTTDHRALQQDAFDVAYRMLVNWSNAYDNGTYDVRNESACKLSNQMIKALKF